MSRAAAPALLGITRIASFLTCLLVALASGTNYVFSAYGPQLGARLGLSHIQLNIIGLSGNIGVYGSAPIWGRIADTRGPRSLLVMAFFALAIGYTGIRYFFDKGLPENSSSLSLFGICMLVFFGFLTGLGGNGGLVTAMNATAKSWPDRARATMNGIVISGFGLSAFLFSTLAHLFFPGNTSDFLLVLAIGTSLPMILGFFLIRPIPLSHSELSHSPEDEAIEEVFDAEAGIIPPMYHDNNSQTHLLSPHVHHHVDDDELADPPLDDADAHLHPAHAGHLPRSAVVSDYFVPSMGESVAMSPTRESGRQRSRSAFSVSRPSARNVVLGPDMTHTEAPNVSGKSLFADRDFWILFAITALLSGTGLMYINNVGSISQALFAQGNPDYNEAKSAQWQAAQVSIISIMNCIGRISIGVLADFTKSVLRLPRSFCMTLVATLFVTSQVICYHVESVGQLWRASALLGFAYGGMFGLFPTITIEWFGLPHFSENWGFVSLSPVLGSNVFSIAFGRNLDAHAPGHSTSVPVPRAGLPSSTQCLEGRSCYTDSLKLTIGACSVALALALYAGWRDRRRQLRIAQQSAEAVPELVLEEDEEDYREVLSQ
ncbi:MFS general substrate transporter [Laetiporus sulphureus 93-53]|uniref:MFS general substrate transporter n=1 Tax=Laetiporus sulphureus 93-53 TaxID=1314785 RepID=A0A165ILM8_9APHY|nr:MFS general substrate transporter [Laetiporus sulphureus 93-53]KZT13250.1 MFS general substrate transporter [Laetiporus sulphureus 93-53]